MKTVITKTDVYKFDELSDKAKNNAVEHLYDINVDYDWWDFLYKDAANIWLTITEFDAYYRHEINGKFENDAVTIARKIREDHGKKTVTHRTAVKFLAAYRKLKKAEKEELTNDDDMVTEFRHELLSDYLRMLREEYEYRTSREVIIETIEANDYDFTIDGKLF